MTDKYDPKQQAVSIDTKGTVYLLTPISKRLLQHLAEHGEATYADLSAALNATPGTLMVYAQRLAECGLIDRQQWIVDDSPRATTFLSLKVDLTFDINTIKV